MTRMSLAEYQKYVAKTQRAKDDGRYRLLSVKQRTHYADPSHEHIDGGFVLTIPGEVPPGLNELRKLWSDPSHKEYREMRDAWVLWLKAALGSHRPSYMRARIEMTMYRLGSMDRDNLEASFKIIGDALQIAGVIPDDDTTTIERPPVVSVKVAHYADIKTVLEITELK